MSPTPPHPPSPGAPIGDPHTLLSTGSLVALLSGAAALAIAALFARRLFAGERLSRRAALAGDIPGSRWLLAGLSGWLAWFFGMALGASYLANTSDASLADAALWSAPAYLAGIATVFAGLWTVRARAVRAGMRASVRDLPAGALGTGLGIPITLAIGTLAFAAASEMARLADSAPPDEIAHGTLRQILDLHAEAGLSWWVLPIALQIVVLAPIFEELLYRGCLQSAFVSATGKTWPSVAAASALFALIHASGVPWHAMPTLFAVGFICGIAFERTGRIGTPILIHAAFNALNLGLALATAGNG